MIIGAKNEYMLRTSKKLNNSSTVPKSHWFILNNKKIPPVFHNGKVKVISDFKEKVNL